MFIIIMLSVIGVAVIVVLALSSELEDILLKDGEEDQFGVTRSPKIESCLDT